MTLKKVTRSLCLGTAVVGMALASPYSWTGNGTDDHWDNSDNWDCLGFCLCTGSDCGYPRTGRDDAGFRTGGPHAVDLRPGNITVDDLDICVDVDFASASPGTSATLTVDSLIIAGSTIVTFTSDATITK